MDSGKLLARTAELALEFLRGLPERRVGATASAAELRASLGGDLPERGEDPVQTIERLAGQADPGLVAWPARATSASSSAATCRPRWPPTG